MADTRWKAILEARGNLTEYINSLWNGRSSTPAEWKLLYTERLAAAARLTTLLEQPLSFDAAREILRQENKFFPRDFLMTDQGRDIRSKFNLLSRAVSVLEDHVTADGSITTGPETLVGTQLSSVTFIHDYVELDFQGQGFSAFCPITIEASGVTVDSQSDGFRDRLCGIINQIVRTVQIDDRSVKIEFSDRVIQLVFADGTPELESLIYTGLDNRVQVF